MPRGLQEALINSAIPRSMQQQSRKPIHEGGERAWMDQEIYDCRYRSEDQKPILHGCNSRKVISSSHYARGASALNPACCKKPGNW